MSEQIFEYSIVRSARPLAADEWFQVRISRPYPKDEYVDAEKLAGDQSLAKAVGRLCLRITDPQKKLNLSTILGALGNVDSPGKLRSLLETEPYKEFRTRIASSVAPDDQTLPRSQLLILGILERIPADEDSFEDDRDVRDWLASARIIDDVLVPQPVDDAAAVKYAAAKPPAVRTQLLQRLTRTLRLAAGPVPVPGDGLARPPAIGELHILERSLCCYQSNEVAAIENVLRGETRKHKSRVVDEDERLDEQAVTKTSERTTSVETRDSSELRTEVQKTVQEDNRFSLAVNVEAQYPPYVKVTSDAGIDTSTQTSRTDSSSSSTAQEVTNASAKRLADTQLQRQLTVSKQRREDTQEHSFDRKDKDEDAVGVYNFVDAVWEAQPVTYRQRALLCEFLLLQPGAWLSRALDARPQFTAIGEKPSYPTVETAKAPGPFGTLVAKLPLLPLGTQTTSKPLTPQSITRGNWARLIQENGASSPPPPPPEQVDVAAEVSSKNFSDTPEAVVSYTAVKELVVPDDYAASSFYVSVQSWTRIDSPGPKRVCLNVGGIVLPDWVTDDAHWSSIWYAITPLEGIVPVTVQTDLARGFTGSVTMRCTLKADAYERWQIAVFNRIIDKYQTDLEEYEAKLSVAQQQQADVAPRAIRSSDARRIISSELKKWCIYLLEGGRFPRSSKEPTTTTDAETGWPFPRRDLTLAEGPRIQFIEQAFEWTRMQWNDYDYIWANKADWPTLSLLDSPDPDLTLLLRAGAVRLIVPVREHFVDAALRYLKTGEIWNGGKIPIPGDDLYVSLALELSESLDKPVTPEEVGEKWTYRVPTPHTVLGKLNDCAEHAPA